MEEASKGRFRFSRRSIVVAIVLVALSVLHLRASRELSKVRSDLTLVRIQLGEIVVDDPTKVHVFARPTHVDDEYEWRLYVPPGGKYKLLTDLNDLQIGHGIPNSRTIDAQSAPTDYIDSGLYTIRFCGRPVFVEGSNAKSWTWGLTLISDDHYGRVRVACGREGQNPVSWAESNWDRKVQVAAEHGMLEVDPSDEVVLYEMRCVPPGTPKTQFDAERPKLLVHLVPVNTP